MLLKHTAALAPIYVVLRIVDLIENASEQDHKMPSQADPVMAFARDRGHELHQEGVGSIAHPSPSGKALHNKLIHS